MYNSEISIQAFQMFIESLQNGSFVDLLQLQDFYEQIIVPVIRSKPKIIDLYRNQLENLIKIIFKKLNNVLQSKEKQTLGKELLYQKEKQMFPEILKIVRQIDQAIGPLKRITQKSDIILQNDTHFLNFLRDQKVRLVNLDQSSFYDYLDKQKQKIKVRMPVLISSKLYTKQWQTPFTVLRQNFKNQKDSTLMEKDHETYKMLKESQFSLPMCLGCTEYYYEKVNIRYLDIQQVDVISMPKIKDLNNHKDLLKNSICALLNGGGGIILFDCLEQYMQILPIGTYISQKEKQLYMQQISELFKYFYPKITFGINIDLKFIPIALNPFQNPESACSPQFVKGKYVTRLRLWNNERYRLISYEHGNNQYAFYTRSAGHTIRLTKRQLIREIKITFNKFYCPERYNKDIFQRSANIFENHQCLEPKMGIQLENKQKDDQQMLNEYDLQNIFHYVSFLFLRSQDPQNFEMVLKRTHGIKLQIVPHNPPTGDNFCLLFHDTGYKDIKIYFKNAVDSLEVQFNKNNIPILLFVENGLELANPLNERSFNQLAKYIKSKNSTEILKYFQGKNKYYLTSQFKVTLFFLLGKLRQMKVHNTKIVKLDLAKLITNQNFKVMETCPTFPIFSD